MPIIKHPKGMLEKGKYSSTYERTPVWSLNKCLSGKVFWSIRTATEKGLIHAEVGQHPFKDGIWNRTASEELKRMGKASLMGDIP